MSTAGRFTALVGAVAYRAIKAVLEAPTVGPMVVAIALIVGGVLILIIERLSKTITTKSVEEMPWRTALTTAFASAIRSPRAETLRLYGVVGSTPSSKSGSSTSRKRPR